MAFISIKTIFNVIVFFCFLFMSHTALRGSIQIQIQILHSLFICYLTIFTTKYSYSNQPFQPSLFCNECSFVQNIIYPLNGERDKKKLTKFFRSQ